jgi:hypothetical protein
LWVAYGWWERSEKVEAQSFVQNFFKKGNLESAKAKIGPDSTRGLEGYKDTFKARVEPTAAKETFRVVLERLESLFL